MTRSVTAAGRFTTFKTTGPNGRVIEWVLWSDCDKKGVGYFCEPCRASLPHLEALVVHLQDDRDHHIARSCPEHGYEAMPFEQLRALVGAAA